MDYSILMSIYKDDNPEYLAKSIESMLKQTFPSNDFVIVKDGPLTDKLNMVIDKYIDENKELFQIISLPKNVGLGEALSIGILHCKNELIARMDADDIAYEYRCQMQLDVFRENPDLDIVGSYVDEFSDDEKNIIRTKMVPIDQVDIMMFSRQRNPFNHPTVMYKKSKVIGCGNYSNMRTNQDVELWVRMLHNGCKAKNVPYSLVLFRFDEKTYKRRKKWNNVYHMISLWYIFYKNKYCSLWDLTKVSFVQLVIFLSPIIIIKWIYSKFR